MTASFHYPPESKPLEGFTIKRAIQRGGFGEVYFALSDAGKEVALKLLQSNYEVELRGVAQCLNLKHPNLLTIFDVKQNAIGERWIVMEYMAGKTLDEVLAAHPQGMSSQQIDGLLSGIAAGVSYLHEQGLVHRDLKPANIYVEQGHVKIGDVGLSKFISTSQRSGHTESVGTVYYMAPEIAHGRYGREIDVYALGVILFEMLTGKVPFDGETTGEILMKQLTLPPDLSALPAALQPVLKKALAKDPAQRTVSPSALVDDFRRATQSTTSPMLQAPPDVPRAIPIAKSPQPVPVFVNVPPSRPVSDKPAPERPVQRPQRIVPASEVFMADEHVSDAVNPQDYLRLILSGSELMFMAFGGVIVGVILMRTFHAEIPIWIILVCSIAMMAIVARVLSVVVRRTIGISTTDPASTSLVTSNRPRNERVRRLNSEYHRYRGPETRQLNWPDRLAEMFGSMSVAALCAGLISFALWWLDAYLDMPVLAFFFAVGTTLGSWAAIIPAKLWEGRKSDGVARRITTMLMGGIAGGAMFAMSDFLSLSLNIECAEHVAQYWAPMANFSNSAAMSLQGYVMFFAALMVARRWAFHVDAFRERRLKFLTVIVTTLAALVIAPITGFPIEWAVLWGLTISTTSQLAAVWVPNEARRS